MNHLNERQLNILREIARMDGFVTFSDLAQKLSVSSRTIIRELDDCSEWLRSAGIELERKAGQGIRFLTGDQTRDEWLAFLEEHRVTFEYATPDRQLYLRQCLLRDEGPFKLFTLAHQLKMAESTISSDLSRLEDWFSSYHLELVRKPGLGIYLSGSEENRRLALLDLLHEVWNENSLIELMLHQHESAAGRRLRTLLQFSFQDLEHLRSLIQIVEVWEKQNQLVHRERSFLGLILAMLILSWCKDRPLDRTDSESGESLGAMALANNLLEETALTLNMPWLTGEVMYIARQLPVLYPEITDPSALTADRPWFDAADLARQMINVVQQETGYAIHDEDVLVDALASHLQLAMTRLVFKQAIHNPLEKEIRDHYPQWFDLARKCSSLIETALSCPVPDAETAYLTLYLGAAMEKAASRSERRYHIAVLCPIGMSSSVLLASRVEAIFPQVTVDAIISFKQAPEIILQQRLDMILTTADISLPGIPVLMVRPFFPESDQEKFREFLKNLLPRKITPVPIQAPDLLQELRQVNELVSGLTSLLSHFFFLDSDATSLDIVIEQTARQILPGNAPALARALAQRESFGHLVLGEQQMAMLHTRTDDVKDLHFGLIRLQKALEIDGQSVSTILAMAAPQAIAPVKLDIMRLISRSIIDDDHFALALREGNAQAIYSQLERLLKNHFPINRTLTAIPG